MAKSIKRQIAKITADNMSLNKKVLCLKDSFDEVYSILNKPHKKKKKKKPYK